MALLSAAPAGLALVPANLPLLADVPQPLLVLITVGLTGLLVILRFDAQEFGAAEYDEADRWGNPPSLMRRLAWYTLGIGGILVILAIHPNPSGDLFLGLGDRLGAVILGLTAGAVGTAIALGIAFYRYRYLRFPPGASYPGAMINALATAFVDEAVFRGLVFGFMVVVGMDPTLANIIQALLYALATRKGEVVSKRTLLAEVWQQAYGGGDRTVDVHLSWLRRKLGETAAEPRYLHTVRGVGIRCAEPDRD